MNINMKKIKYQLCMLLFIAFAIASCEDQAVDKQDLKSITSDVIWNEPAFIKGALDAAMSGARTNMNDLNSVAENTGVPDYERELMGHSEEGYSRTVLYDSFNANDIDQGISWQNIDRWSYSNIRNINRFLDAEKAGLFTPKLAQATKEDYLGQMLVLRAYLYFDMVRTYGGVPLVLKELMPGQDDLFVPRSKTSECIAQIVADLDAAIALPGFPIKRTVDVDAGRINKGAAYALKGRVLLYYASPQFSRTVHGTAKSADVRWEEAYQACKTAVQQLSAAGYGLYKPTPANADEAQLNYYNMFIKDEAPGNPEMIWVRRHQPNIDNFRLDTWDFCPSSAKGRTGTVSLEFANAFSNADGTPFTGLVVDASKDSGHTMGDITYGEAAEGKSDGSLDGKAFWENREPRFYATIGYNGAYWPLIRIDQTVFPADVATLNGKAKLLHEWNFIQTAKKPFDDAYSSTSTGPQGLLIRKFVSEDLDRVKTPIDESGVDWPIIRYAEVLLNYAEAAAKTGKNELGSPLSIVGQIRQRAGIPSANNYGVGNPTGDALILTILKERQVELALESHRYYDLRRWRIFTDGLAGYKLNGTSRHTITANFVGNLPEGGGTPINANLSTMIERISTLGYNADKSVKSEDYFKVFYHAIRLLDSQPINYTDKYDFLRIPYKAHIQANPAIAQTIGWVDIRGENSSTFDPYE
jgi:hypothetical protein